MVIKFRSAARARNTCAAGAVSVAVVLLLAGCSASGPAAPVSEAAPEALSATEAGGIYLDAVCPVNAAWDDADLELERLRLTVSRGGDDTRRFSAAMEQVAKQSATAAHELDPEALDRGGDAWPATALDEIEAVQQTLKADEKQAAKVARLDADEVLAYTWKGSAELGAAAADARAALGLPADGESACAQWAKQSPAEKTKEKQ